MSTKLKPFLIAIAILLFSLGFGTLLLFNSYEVCGLTLLVLTLILVLVIYLIALDAYGKKNYLFFSGIGTNNFVILGNLGGVAIRYLARIKGHNYDPKTGRRVYREKQMPDGTIVQEEMEQQNFYDNWFLNYLANYWDIYYKGLNTKLLKPDWCDSTRIPHAKVRPWKTDECKVKGLAHNTHATLTFEQSDLSMYLYLNWSDVLDEILKPDYESNLRAFFATQGEKKDYDVRKILGVNTEGKMDKEFEKQVWNPTVASAQKYGNELVNIAIADIVPANEDVRKGVERQALAEINKKATITEAEGASKADRLNGKVRVDIETRLRQAGVDRMALAVEKQPTAKTLVVSPSPQTPLAIPSSNED